MLDSAYARIQGAAGVVNIDTVELPLTCEAALFEAPSLVRFQSAVERAARLIMPCTTFREFGTTAPPTIDCTSLQTILTMFYLRVSAARHRLPVSEATAIESQSFSPAEAFARDSTTLCVVKNILLLPSLYLKQLQSGDTMNALAWNNLGLSLTADIDLLEVASGRKGLEAAQVAMVTVGKWAKSASARRAILHAAQIFSVLSSTRLRESNTARPDLLLFTSALVLSMYLFVVDKENEDNDLHPFELLQEVDWAAIGGEGVLQFPGSPVSQRNDQLSRHSKNEALDFIRHGGWVSFAGEALDGGTNTARKIMTNYVHLLDELGKWRGSRYSQLLRTMSDFAIEGTGGQALLR